MFSTSYLCSSDLNRFMTHWTIHELGLHDQPTSFYIHNIDDRHSISLGQHLAAAPVFMPSYFSSVLCMNQSGMQKASRPMTHELVSPNGQIFHSNQRTRHIYSNCWSILTTTPIPAYQDIHQSNLCSPSLLFSLSSLSLNKEERQNHLPGRKFPDLSSTHSSDSPDSGSDNPDHTLGRSQHAIKDIKSSRIRKQIEGCGM